MMKNTKSNTLLLENQLCFPLYTASRLVIRLYGPLLERLGLTYLQYIVLMILWEDSPVRSPILGSARCLKQARSHHF